MVSRETYEIIESDQTESNSNWYVNTELCLLKEGYDLERFVTLPRKDFQCPICLGVVREPLECTQCGILICRKCACSCGRSQYPFYAITSASASPRFNCPICRSRTHPREPSAILKKLISSLVLYCKNKCHSCPEFFPLSEIRGHEKNCKFKSIRCANHALCNKQGSKIEFIPLEFSGKGKNGTKIKLVCSEICKKVIIMDNMLKNDQGDKAANEFRIALESLNNIKK